LQDPTPGLHQALAAADREGAPVSAQEQVLLQYAQVLTKSPAQVADSDVDALRQAGWTEPQIAEATYIIALFAFFNRVADAFGLPDPNYFRHAPSFANHPPPRE
jgi:alkylhydroperoxidase family enzyme